MHSWLFQKKPKSSVFFIYINHVYLPSINTFICDFTYGQADNVCARLLIFKAVHIETEIHADTEAEFKFLSGHLYFSLFTKYQYIMFS